MSGKVYIAQPDLEKVLSKLAGEMDVWIPAASANGKWGVEFMPYRSGSVPVLNRQSSLPPKKVLLPQMEALLRFEYQKDPEDPSKLTLRLDDPTAGGSKSRPVLVFGARPCDTRGFLTFDRTFTNGPYVDAYYRKRREDTFFATLVCSEADSACFCSSVGSGPADMDGSDLRLIPIEGGYVLEALNERAGFILDSLESLKSPPTEKQEDAAKQVIDEISSQPATGFPPGTVEAFRGRFENLGYWQEAVGQCLSCGICTYVCPTCYCFTITDETKNLEGTRLRSWDSCMFFHYTSEASGHNPRPTKLERYRNRVGHKFSYIPTNYDGMIGCCGCGRCIRLCPVSIDIRKVVQGLKEEACESA
jgi:sulfhydrogenase subunit beta (sulfur reductase)